MVLHSNLRGVKHCGLSDIDDIICITYNEEDEVTKDLYDAFMKQYDCLTVGE